MFKRISILLLVSVVALAGVGILIASTSAEEAVAGFTDDKCRDNGIQFLNMEEMNAYSAKDNGWTYRSYVTASNPEKCLEVVRARGTPLPEWELEIPEPEYEVSGGSRGGGESGGGGSSVSYDPNYSNGFGTTELKNLKKCWEKKISKLKNAEIQSIGCFNNVNFNYRKTNYKWVASSEQPTTKNKAGILGSTIYHHQGTYEDGNTFTIDNTVFLYPNNIWGGKLMRLGARFDHVAMIGALDEQVHTIQGTLAKNANSNWENPKPWEWYDMQVEANIVSNAWYKALFDGANPPVAIYTESIVNKHKDSECKFKGAFKRKKEQYEKYEVELAGTITDVRKATVEKEMKKIVSWFKDEMPENHMGIYSKNADLGCDPEASD